MYFSYLDTMPMHATASATVNTTLSFRLGNGQQAYRAGLLSISKGLATVDQLGLEPGSRRYQASLPTF
jgi:hypothetical protein